MWSTIGMVNTKYNICACVVNLKQNQASFSLHLTVWSCLQLPQMCISLASDDFRADNDNRQTNRLLYPLCMRVGQLYYKYVAVKDSDSALSLPN